MNSTVPIQLRSLFKVMIVDDSDAIRERLLNMLRAIPGIGLLAQAHSCIQALQLMAEVSPDVAILDIHMPGKSGIALLEEIKRQPPYPTVIVLTNYPYIEYRFRCINAGADYFFEKSAEFEQVVEVVGDLAANHSTACVEERQNERANPP
ncbi:MAG: hypothetical protein A2X46_04050 [Lentisphaerae bacterium GWF2_57_35]|nr:MAG: hypothetical protein A2X46_04050 [Lentisphaerae bacterium GWF2_57_35]